MVIKLNEESKNEVFYRGRRTHWKKKYSACGRIGQSGIDLLQPASCWEHPTHSWEQSISFLDDWVTEVWIKGLLYSNKVKNKWFFIHLGADNNHSFTLPQLVLIKTSRSIETHTECELACVTVCVSPHHSGVQDISAGTLFFRSHSGKTSSPHPTLILPGSHTNTQWCSGAVRTLQQPAALSFMNIHVAGQSSGSFH